MIKLNPDERLLIEKSTNHYHIVGPGKVWIKPWQQVLTKLNVGLQGQRLQFNQVRTVENVPLDVTLHVLYQIDTALFTADLLPSLPHLNEGGWQGILKSHTEYRLRSLLAGCAWQDLSREETQSRVERRLTQTLADALKGIGLKIITVWLVKTELPADLQQTLVQIEQDNLASQRRSIVLKEYFDLFGNNLPQVMPYIIQWELLGMLWENSNPDLILTSNSLSLDQGTSTIESIQPVLQMRLPMPTRDK
jgi:regulator of protease activity HflC (stomatin/prohibitin superfamily)